MGGLVVVMSRRIVADAKLNRLEIGDERGKRRVEASCPTSCRRHRHGHQGLNVCGFGLVLGPAHQSSRRNPLTKSKCRSRLKMERVCCRQSAAIQTSLEGIGVPASL